MNERAPHPAFRSADGPPFDWLNEPRLRRIINAFDPAGPDALRFVGGCVRDSLLGVAPKDFDLATPVLPERVIDLLKAKGVGVAPTGLAHGTVTAVADGFVAEITTLRADVATDGRRATVAFTTDWSVDAARRDFTINALYLTPARGLYDPVGGMADLTARRVRFIGSPAARIAEDYLRILRFFRFSARFASGLDEAGLAACAAARAGLSRLSAERVGAEMAALLALPAPAEAVAAMDRAGVLAAVWPARADVERLAALKRLDPAAPAALGLAALWGGAGEGLGPALRLSNADEARRADAVGNAAALGAALAAAPDQDAAARRLAYRFGAEAFRDAALLASAADAASPARQFIDLALTWRPPARPFAGRDVLALGVPPGPQVAEILNLAEEAWLAEGLPGPARAATLLREAVLGRTAGSQTADD